MKISILTTGSRGDMQPLAALGAQLAKRGASVTLATSSRYESWCRGLGMDFHKVRGDVSELIKSGELSNAINADNPVKALKALNDRRFAELLDRASKDLLAACEGAELILHHPGAGIGSMYGRAAGIPAYVASPFPLTPTANYPSLLFARLPLPRFANRLTHVLFLRAFWCATGGSGVRVAREAGLISTRRPENPLLGSKPVFVSSSDYVFPVERPSVATGFWFVDDEPFEPPAALKAFLESGDPPLYAGFGSVGNPARARETGEILLTAARSAGKRLLIAGGYGGLELDSDTGDDVLFIESAPHSWLFPRVSAVIHHGGAGTTAAGLRAGVPSIIIPHGNDQFAWARAVQRLGVGCALPGVKRINAADLVRAIKASAESAIGRAASDLGEKIRSEAGAPAMAEHILRLGEG